MLYRLNIRLDTLSEIEEFVNIINKEFVNEKIELTDGNNYRINAKSLFGCLSTVDWNKVVCESYVDIYSKISKFVI